MSRYGFNLVSTLRYRQNPPALSAPAQDVVRTLRRDGVIVADSRALLGPDAALLDRVQDRVRALKAEHATVIEERRAALARDGVGARSKDYLVELLGTRPEVDPRDPLVQFALQEQVLGIAEAYFETRVRLHDVNVWQNLATDAPASKSQKWHRDLLEDTKILKAFLYVDDVPAGAGPLRYVKGTNTPQGRKIKLPSQWDGIGFRVEDELIDATFEEPVMVEALGRAGDVAWADTLGLHRGGHAKTVDRLVVMYTFCSPACCRPKSLVPAQGVSRADLPRVSLRR
ncbi:phytanoyl-CoA dioxygenase family protein [Kineococcus rhizosphaerae]|uniref:phytanoyl-CoA dioxygenase family protein n=1 Tax=Kineococcus rhizosphaerae TaxID=559628 RepID=UPI0011B1E6F7|nr:hypothetical protein [Kineococcus rhizosphaerae]